MRFRIRDIRLKLVLCALLTATVMGSEACARHMPPNLTPEAASAWKRHEIQKDLDVVRDIAVDAEKQKVLKEATTRKVVEWHRQAILTINAGTAGWQASIAKGLDGLKDVIPADEYPTLTLYIALAKTVIKEVAQ